MADPTTSKYGSLGVDVDKKGIEELKAITNDLFPQAFCSVTRHPASNDRGMVLHEDGVGSKTIIAYLCNRETGERRWFETLSDDVIAMNVDDVICVGAKPITFSDYIALNSFNVDRGALLSALAKGFAGTFRKLNSLGSPLSFCGGETADLPDVVGTFDLSGTVYAEVPLSEVITGDGISPGDIIVGIRSGGSCSYETGFNSGLMCNGITLARHSLLSAEYSKQYPEISSGGKKYTGRYRLDSEPEGLASGLYEALLSPTRLFLPIIADILGKIRPQALVHNTGGGLTKCRRLGKNILYIKDQLPEPDPIFSLIKRESGIGWDEMYRDFNMGVGFEVIVRKGEEETVLRSAEKYGVGAQVIGRCERQDTGNAVLIESNEGSFVIKS